MTDSRVTSSSEEEDVSSSSSSLSEQFLFQVKHSFDQKNKNLFKGEEQPEGEAPAARSLISLLLRDYPDLFENRQKFQALSLISSNQRIVEGIDFLVAFSISSLQRFVSPDSKLINKRKIKKVVDSLYMLGYLDVRVLKTNLRNAQVYYVRDDPRAEERILRLKKIYDGYLKEEEPAREESRNDSIEHNRLKIRTNMIRKELEKRGIDLPFSEIFNYVNGPGLDMTVAECVEKLLVQVPNGTEQEVLK